MSAMNSTCVQDALEDQRHQVGEDVARIKNNIAGDLESESQVRDLEELVQTAKRLGALDQVCAEHGITDAVQARRLS